MWASSPRETTKMEERKMKKFVLPVISLVVIALLVIACGEPKGTPTPTPPPAVDILNAATKAMEEVDSLHMVMTVQMTMTMSGTEIVVPMTFEGDVQNPDRAKGTLAMEALGQKLNMEMIVISDTTYIRESPTAEWQVTPTEDSGSPFDPEEMAQLKPEDMKDLAFVAEEEVGGRPAYHVTGKVTSALLNLEGLLGEGSEAAFDADYWVDKENSYLLKARIAGNMVMTGETEATVDMWMTLLFSDYNKPVTIEAPE